MPSSLLALPLSIISAGTALTIVAVIISGIPVKKKIAEISLIGLGVSEIS